MGRAPCCDKANVKKGQWSIEEDRALKTYLETHGTGVNWINLPQKAGLRRCGKSCRLRWLNYLRPDIKHGNFTQEEDNIICNLYTRMGSRWSQIAAEMPGRTDNDVKNYWNTKLKKKYFLPSKPSLKAEESKRPNLEANDEFETQIGAASVSLSQDGSSVLDSSSVDNGLLPHGNNSFINEDASLISMDFGYDVFSQMWFGEKANESVHPICSTSLDGGFFFC